MRATGVAARRPAQRGGTAAVGALVALVGGDVPDRRPHLARVRRGAGPRDRRLQVAGRRRLGRRGLDPGAVRDHAGHDREHRVDRSLRGSEVRGVPGRGDRERARRGRVSPCERRKGRGRCVERGQLLREQRPDRGRRRAPRPRHREDPRSVRDRDAGVGTRVGPPCVRADRREADDLLEPELLADEHGQHAVVRRPRLPAVDRPLGCVRADRARGELGRARLDVLAVDLHRTRRRDRRGCRSRSLQGHEPGAGEDRVPRGHPAGRRSDHRRPDRLRRRRIHVQPAREPRHGGHARRHARSGRHVAPLDRGVRRGRLGADVRRAAARHEDGLGRVRLPRRRRASGERCRHRHLDTRTARLRNDLRGSVRRGVDGDPHRGGGLRVDVRRLERCVLRHRPGLFVPGVVAHRRGGDVPVRGERGGGRRRRGLRVGSLDRRARRRRLLPLGASGRRLGDLRVLRRRGDALHGLGSIDGQGADPDRRGVDGHDRRLRAGSHHAGEASLRGSRSRSARPDGGGARDEAPRRLGDPGRGGRAAVGRADRTPILPRRRSDGRARRMPPPAGARTRSATPGTRPPSSRSRGPACRSARCADRRWAGRRSGWTARS